MHNISCKIDRYASYKAVWKFGTKIVRRRSIDEIDIGGSGKAASGGQTGRVLSRPSPFYLFLSLPPVLPTQVQSDAADSHEEEESPREQEHDARDPNGVRLVRGAAPHHEDQSEREHESRRAAAKESQVEVSLRGPLAEAGVKHVVVMVVVHMIVVVPALVRGGC